jgi:hypothetical protein
MVVCGSCFDIERATQWMQALERFIDRYGCPFLYAECRTYYGRVLFENGDWEAAVEFLTEAIALAKGVYPAPHAFACGTLAELRLAQGRSEDAARTLEGLEGRDDAGRPPFCTARGEPSWLPPWRKSLTVPRQSVSMSLLDRRARSGGDRAATKRRHPAGRHLITSGRSATAS